MKWKITILSFLLASFLLARTSTFCCTTTLRSTSRSRPTQIPRSPIAGSTRFGWAPGPVTATGATRLGWVPGPVTATGSTRLGWAPGPVTATGATRFGWAPGPLTVTGATRFGRPIAGATRLGGTSGQAWTAFRMVRASSTSPSTSWPGASRFLRKSHIVIYL